MLQCHSEFKEHYIGYGLLHNPAMYDPTLPLESHHNTTPTGGLNSTKNTLAEDMTSEAANLIGSLSRHTEDSLDIENLKFEGRQNIYGPELDIRPLEIPGEMIN